MSKNTKLVITDISDEYRQLYLNLADALELTRSQLLILLMSEQNIIPNGMDNVFDDDASRAEWVEMLVMRLFKYVA